MYNFERLQLEIKDIKLDKDEFTVYLEEHGLNPFDQYDPKSISNKRKILQTALSVLESIANQPGLMKSYKQDDISVSQFSENLQNRIDQLERKIRQMRIDDDQPESNFFMLFNK